MELRERLDDAVEQGYGNDPVKVLGEEGAIYSITQVVPENHEDAGGASTVWVRVEED